MKTNKGVAVALTAAILASGGGVSATLMMAQPASAAMSQSDLDAAVAQIVNDTNAERVKVGLAPLTYAPHISQISQAWSVQMATQGAMVHNPQYAYQMPAPWMHVGENVAQGYTPTTVVAAWMASEGHRANILGDYTHIGIGYYVDATGRGWFTQNFGKYEPVVAPSIINDPTTTVGKFDFTSTWATNPNEFVSDYVAELYASDGTTLLQTKNSSTPNVSFSGLTDLTNYIVKVTARAIDVPGVAYASPVKTFNVTTLEDLPAVTPVTGLTLTTGEDSATAQWTAPATAYGTMSPYHVQLLENGVPVQTVDTPDSSYVFSGLKSNTNYSVNVTATTTVHTKTATATASAAAKTLLSSKANVSEANNVTVTSDIFDTVKANWEAPSQQIGVGLKYRLTLSTAGKPDVITETTSTNYSFTGLTSKTPYTVKVQSIINSENGLNTSTTAGVDTSVVTPPNYDEVAVTAPNLLPVKVEAKQATLSWDAPASFAGKLNGYTVTVRQVGQPDRIFNTNLNSYVVTGLTENTTYTFEVKANASSLNDKFVASASSVPSTQTTPYAPDTVIVSAPQALSVQAPAFNQVTASWTAPANLVGSVTGYTVTLKSGGVVVKTQTVTGLNTTFTDLNDSTNYTVEVSALATSADTTNSAVSTLVAGIAKTPAYIAAPNAPTGLTASSVAYNSATLTWVAPTGVYGNIADYTVTVKEAGKADRIFKSNGTTFTVTGLTENNSYSAQVVANVVSHDGTKTATTPLTAVGVNTPYSPSTVKVSAPTGVAISAVTHSSMVASWGVPTAVIGNVTGYTATLKAGGVVVKTQTVTGLTTSFTGLTDSTTYTVEVTAQATSPDKTTVATSTVASSNAATDAYVEAPNAPTGFRASTVAFNEATLAWAAPTGIYGKIVNYTVVLKEAGKPDRIFTTVGTSLLVTGLTENNAYTATVVANASSRDGSVFATTPLASIGLNTPFSPSSVKVNAPTGLALSGVAYNSLSASWVAPTGTLGTLTGYRATLKSGTTVVATKTVTGPNVTFDGLSDSTAYTVEVAALAVSPDQTVNIASSTITSDVVTTPAFVAAPNAVTGVTASAVTDKEATLAWDAPTGVYGKLVDYTVTVKQAGQADRTFQSVGTIFKVTGLTENTDYTVQIVANVVSHDGVLSATSPVANFALKSTYPVDAVRVSAPTGLTVAGITYNSMVASWAAPAGTIGNSTGYIVTVKQDGNVKATYTTTGTSYTITGLDSNSAYTVEVKAGAVSANGANTATSDVTATAATTAKSPIVSVNAPTATISDVTADHATVSWTKPNVTGTLTGYKIIVKLGNTVVKVIDADANATSANLTDLAEGSNYGVTVVANAVAEDGVTTSQGSSAVSTITTPFTDASQVKAGEFATTVTGVTPNTVTATWTTPTVKGKIVDYTVVVSQGGTVVASYNTTDNATTVAGLNEKTSYTIQVKANVTSDNGKYNASSSTLGAAFVTTASPVPAVMTPYTLPVMPTSNSIIVDWKRGSVFQKLINPTQAFQPEEKIQPEEKLVSGFNVPVSKVLFLGLDEKATYRVAVRANALAFNGKYKVVSRATSKTLAMMTSAGSMVAVAAPTALSLSSTTDTVIASWKTPSVTGTLTSYTVTIMDGNTRVKTIVTTGTKADFSDLKANTAYKVVVTANAKSVNGTYTTSSVAADKTITTQH